MEPSSVSPFQGRPGGALVVGASGAIGQAVTLRLARMGAPVTATYATNRDRADSLVATVVEQGLVARAARLDLADTDSVLATVREAVEAHGGLHTVVLAGTPTNWQSYVSVLDHGTYARQLAADSGGSFAVVTAALPALRETRGSIVAVTTVANRRYVIRDVLSSGPKAANEALIRAVAAEEGRYGVRANAVGVGILDEGMTQVLVDSGDIRPGDLEHARSRVPLGVLGKAEDIAAAVGFLASPDAGYITGQCVDVDGGYSL